MQNTLLIVDNYDNIIDYGEKMYVHQNGVLHRAFSVFVYDFINNRFLIQKRAKCKYHSGGLWSNSCCSHFYSKELFSDAIKRCIRDELGIEIPLKQYCIYNPQEQDILSFMTMENAIEVGVFKYFSDLGDIKEHEFDHVVICCINQELIQSIQPNPEEVEDFRWMDFEDIDKELSNDINKYTSWFKNAYLFIKKTLT